MEPRYPQSSAESLYSPYDSYGDYVEYLKLCLDEGYKDLLNLIDLILGNTENERQDTVLVNKYTETLSRIKAIEAELSKASVTFITN